MSNNRKMNIRRLTATAMMIALSVVFERLLAPIDLPEIRLSLGNVPIALTSIAISPVYGAICGLAADFLGCIIKGYMPYPFLMLAPVITGFLPYFGIKFFDKCTPLNKHGFVSVAATVTFTNLISSALVTTLGLAIMYGTSFWVTFVPRIPTIIVGTVLDILVLYLLLRSGIITKILSNGGKRN